MCTRLYTHNVLIEINISRSYIKLNDLTIVTFFFLIFLLMSTPTKKPAIYEESTQYQHWRFSPEQLWTIRNKRTEEAIDRVKKNQKKDSVSLFILFNEITNASPRK